MDLSEFGKNIPAPVPANIRGARAVAQEDPYFEDDEHTTLGKTTQWTEVRHGTYISSQETVKSVPAGVYKYQRILEGKCGFVRVPINVDELLVMPNSITDDVLKEIQMFLEKADKFKYYDFLHRRGFLFYGPHGSGKSSLVQQIIKKVVEQGGIVLLCEHPAMLEMGLADLRTVEPNRFVVCLFEDIDALIQRYGEKEILAVLDGESQINKVLNIATTNYPEHLDPRIVARPRRFDKVIRIDWPCKAVRRHYFKHKLKIEDVELDNWVDSTDRFSFAACAELVISVKCLDKPFKQAVKDLRELMTDKPNSRDYHTMGAPVGFSSTD